MLCEGEYELGQQKERPGGQRALGHWAGSHQGSAAQRRDWGGRGHDETGKSNHWPERVVRAGEGGPCEIAEIALGVISRQFWDEP